MNIQNFSKNIFQFYKLKRLKILFGVAVCIAVFNILSSAILPSKFFLAFAADIRTSELVALANADRVARGLPELYVDSRLEAAARAKGEDMIAKDYWAHYGPNGESPWQFILAADFDYKYAGENLAKDFSSAAPIHSAWMGSPSHKSNILNANFTNIGIAAVTGEFQGKETTIVVQMFGTAETIDNTVYEIASEEEQVLPEYVGSEELKEPSITSPRHGDILDTGLFSIRGTASEGEFIEVYDSGSFIGESDITDSVFDFLPPDPHAEGDHAFTARALEKNGAQSAYSDEVRVTVDTIAPHIQKDSFEVQYIEYHDSFTSYVFQCTIEDNPIDVKADYAGEEIRFYQNEDKWIGSIQKSSANFNNVTLYAYDAAGNMDSIDITADELVSMTEDVKVTEEESVESKKWFIENIFDRLLTRSLRGKINLMIVFVLLLFLTVEWIVVTRSGLTREKSNSLWFIPVFAIILFVSVLGAGGEIL